VTNQLTIAVSNNRAEKIRYVVKTVIKRCQERNVTKSNVMAAANRDESQK